MHENLRTMIRNYRGLPRNSQFNAVRVFANERLGSVQPRYINTANTDYMIVFKFARFPNDMFGITREGYLIRFYPGGIVAIVGHTRPKYVPAVLYNRMSMNNKIRMFHANRINNIRTNVPNVSSSRTSSPVRRSPQRRRRN